ncbi:phage late control D family protein [Agrobacterium larrymoorei]|uniref:Contractile injection system protein, VgrG/Pvc8 family n=1 Tax=Agrobacterium larrymoorei TaxID=160699 RepID=A0AAF0HA59_9HYPH|nr:contractile injection system protein, VgrG/Pvc8 family [Agrobacterium larrymoorei]WHA40905.1 contractile injection system protein, VgrG/Pvc8 family [Agrobacterium larrymoorei]
MKPRVEITIDGTPVAGGFYERLKSVTVTDKEGLKSDTVDIDLNDGPPNFLALPRKGAIINVRMGYDNNLASLGTFTADKIDCDCLPYSMKISGKAVDFRSGKLKERQERAWDKTSLGDIVSQIASESDLTPAIDSDLAKFVYEWIGQQDENNLHFLRRLAQRHNGLFSIKQGRLLFSKLGSGKAASGTNIGTVIVTPEIVQLNSLKFGVGDQTKYIKVIAYYQDSDKAQRVEIEADADADGDSVYRIPEPFSSPDEADKAAQAKAKALKRGEGATSVTVIGDTSICAGAPLLYARIRPGLDGVPYIIDTAAHKYIAKGTFTTDISGKLYDGKSSTEGGDESEDSSSGSNGASNPGSKDAGKVAPNSAPGTPKTPAHFLTPRLGRTDEN